jgi:pimeloyl-ACP methyl ester carboxylesterase
LTPAVRRAGYTVLYFDYRGNWGSGGTFSRSHALEDVASALVWVRFPFPAVAREFGIDTTRIALVGHSMGGWLGRREGVRTGVRGYHSAHRRPRRVAPCSG